MHLHDGPHIKESPKHLCIKKTPFLVHFIPPAESHLFVLSWHFTDVIIVLQVNFDFKSTSTGTVMTGLPLSTLRWSRNPG